jgi:hypothetical protein
MRAREFLLESESQQRLDEINMSPSSLRQLASQIAGAQAGMEFEMIVPNANSGDDSGELEPDYDMRDKPCRSIEDVVEFFNDGDVNGRQDVERLQERMIDDWRDWVDSQIYESWEEEKRDVIAAWIRENVDPEEWLELVSDDDDEDAAFEKYVDDQVEDSSSDAYESAFDEYREELQDDYSERDWLEDQGLETMQDVENIYGITWPYWNDAGGGKVTITDIADEFGQAIGRPWNASTNYHGARREAGKYVIEPDGSLDADDSNDAGLEFVSPPLSISEMISDLHKVAKWAAKKGCYTNDSTGLHINVSIPDFSQERLDYTKLALLLGDNYILEQFGRLGNTFAKSSLDLVKTRAQQRPEDIPAMLDKMRQGLSTLAGKMIHSGVTQKYTSINTKGGYVEFRSPGGDWLGEYAADPGKIINTLLRFVVALDAACDPEKYKEEYAKKLFQLLARKDDIYNDSIKFFADYSTGAIPKAALKSFVRQVQLQRSTKKAPSTADSAGDEKQYQVRDASGYTMLVTARNTNAAMQWARENYPEKFRNITDVVLNTGSRPAASTGGNFTGTWKIVDSSGQELYRFSGIGNQQADANAVARRWMQQNPGIVVSGEVSVVPVMS